MKIKLTKELNGKYAGKIDEIITIDPKDLNAIIRQGAGVAVKEPPKSKDNKAEDKKSP